MQTIFVYADESGVFDKRHYDLFCFGGLILTTTQLRNRQLNLYRQAEARVRESLGIAAPDELKATLLPFPVRNKLFRATGVDTRFGASIYQKNVLDEIFENKKTKQRFLDYAFKRGLKNAFEALIRRNKIDTEEPLSIRIVMDEHSTATDGKYELGESIESEFACGVFTHGFTRHLPPILPNLKKVTVEYVDSKDHELVRAADIIANRLPWIERSFQPYNSTGIIIRRLP